MKRNNYNILIRNVCLVFFFVVAEINSINGLFVSNNFTRVINFLVNKILYLYVVNIMLTIHLRILNFTIYKRLFYGCINKR